MSTTELPEPPTITVLHCTPRGALAYVDGVRVRIRTRVYRYPRWLCDEHYDVGGRTACWHIAALAAEDVPEWADLTELAEGNPAPASRKEDR